MYRKRLLEVPIQSNISNSNIHTLLDIFSLNFLLINYSINNMRKKLSIFLNLTFFGSAKKPDGKYLYIWLIHICISIGYISKYSLALKAQTFLKYYNIYFKIFARKVFTHRGEWFWIFAITKWICYTENYIYKTEYFLKVLIKTICCLLLHYVMRL